MVKAKQVARSNAPSTEPPNSYFSSTFKIPAPLRFPLLVLMSFTSSASLYSLASKITAGDLSSVSKSVNGWWEITGLLGWKAAQLAIGWWGGYDSQH